MSRWVEKRTRSVLPVYFAGAVWLLAGLVLPLYSLWALAATAVVSAAVWLVTRRLCPDRITRMEMPFMTGREDVDAMLESVQQKLADLHRLDEAIPDTGLSASIRRMETAGRSILAEVEAHPEKAPQIRRFANYYLPDAVRILELYARLEGQDVQGGNAASVRREVETNAASIATAFENQLDSLFAADALDLSADLEVLNGMLRGQGLTGSDFAQKPEEQ
ncbi:5-bromo-4-chloroindolyl phosphate hydrolysis protein [Gemmiger sp. An120]|uniref:5-bromo-4-chloroindolyl phosphate hydrolysis family protein n=1 Tax=Gemmiger sp. An120 TaxID=1965549 RepID=UPI000B399A9D|nr:5-bromo-4-chloroindolyl phosphate hydrolysis family protein [Gemmiger sp. An120]OUQ40355.1 5-bromo-4-chloroindolyl phosphate hydrolysis protein [Gemmiger sp. An120]HIX32766.1 5-bromo-4-chloroindolyl phosphate hydrolysis family protein [Candidatus Gemmiger avium]